MPDPRLQWQQYAKHGSCTGLDPAAYFARARAAFGRVRYPDMDGMSRQRGLTSGAFAAAFARANPGISPSMLSIRAGRDGWLDEVQLCLDTRLRPRICPPQKRSSPDRARLRIWRGD
jgi:ribonuclease T2